MQIADTIVVDDFFMLEEAIPIITKSVGVRVYDYAFRNFFGVTSVFMTPEEPVVARIGAFNDYPVAYEALANEGIRLVHTPEEYAKCSLLPHWYPLIEDLTPKSVVYEALPTTRDIERDFNWPIFVKGERQTNKHKKTLSIIENTNQFEELLSSWKDNTMLHWQKMVCREFVPLQLVETSSMDRLPSSYEFRLFYWKQQLAGIGKYWYECLDYQLTASERAKAVAVGDEVAKRLSVCFLVVDVAKTAVGNWIVIEVNDGQESGYAGVNPNLLWSTILAIEKATKQSFLF